MPLHTRNTYGKAEAITDNNTTHAECEAVWFTKAAAEQADLYINGAWVNCGTLLPGVVYPVRATGARDSGDAAFSAGELVFLY